MKKVIAGAAALLLGLGAAIVAVAGPATAAAPAAVTTAGPCVGTPEVREYEYTHTTEGSAEQSHTEYRFQTRVKLYGSKEVKDVQGYDFTDGGTTRVDGKTVAGHWIKSSGWHTIPDVIINIVWGPSGVPDSYLGEGSVNLSVYGGPSVTVKYNAHKVQTDEGFTSWGPWSDWSSTDPGASNDLRNVESKKVVDAEAVEPVTETDWFEADPGSPWTATGNERVKTPAVPGVPQSTDPNGDCYVPPTPPVTNECAEYGNGPTSTNLVPLWSNVDTRSSGHYEYVDDGLHVWTDDATSNAKVSLGYPASFPLKHTGTLDLAWSGSNPPPGVNLFVDFGADGSGTLVYEAVYGQDLWLTNGSSAAVKANAPVDGGGNGSQWHGTIDQWLAKYPDATVVGIAFSLGSGVKGDGVISSITAGCNTYAFDYVQPAPQPEPQTQTREETTVDCEAGTVTTVTYERHTGEPTFDAESNTWTQGEWSEWAPVASSVRDATAEECPVTPTPTPTPTDTPTPPLPQGGEDNPDYGLAETGGSAPSPWLPIGGALAVVLGAAAVLGGLIRRHIRAER